MTGNRAGEEIDNRLDQSPFLHSGDSPKVIQRPSPPDKRAFHIVFLIFCSPIAIACCMAPGFSRANVDSPLSVVASLFCVGLIAATPIPFSIYLNFSCESWWFKSAFSLLAGAICLVSINVGEMLTSKEPISFQHAFQVVADLCKGNAPIQGPTSDWIFWNLSILFLTPAVLFATMTPAWIAKQVFQWRLRVPSYGKTAPKLSIFELMAATAFVAIVIAGIRGIAWLAYLDAGGEIPTFFWLLLFVPLAVYAVVVMVVQFVGFWTILRFKDLGLVCGIVLFPLGLMTMVACLAIAANDQRVVEDWTRLIFMLDGFLFSACLPMVLLRGYSYRIVAGNVTQNIEPPPESEA